MTGIETLYSRRRALNISRDDALYRKRKALRRVAECEERLESFPLSIIWEGELKSAQEIVDKESAYILHLKRRIKACEKEIESA